VYHHHPAAGVEVVTRRKGFASAGSSLSPTPPSRLQTSETQSRTLARAWFLSPLAAAGLGWLGQDQPNGLPATAVAALSGACLIKPSSRCDQRGDDLLSSGGSR
jgi:hypothetical protein